MKLKTEAELKKALQTGKFNSGLREATVKFSHEAAATRGETMTETALRLGMKPNTLHRWLQRARAGKGEAVSVNFIEVEGAGARSTEGVEVVWPSGHLVRMGAGDVKAVFAALEAVCCRRG